MFVLLAEEKALQHRLNQSIELDVKTRQLKNELQEEKDVAVMKIQNTTESTMLHIANMIEEGKEVLNSVKEMALNISRQGESAVVTHTH